MRQPGASATSGRAVTTAVVATALAAVAFAVGCGGGGGDGSTADPGAASVPAVRGGSFSAGGTMFDSVLASGALGAPPPLPPPAAAAESARAVAARKADSARARQ